MKSEAWTLEIRQMRMETRRLHRFRKRCVRDEMRRDYGFERRERDADERDASAVVFFFRSSSCVGSFVESW